MALNWTMLDSNGSPVPLPDENIMINISAPSAEVSLTIPDAPPIGSSTSGGSGGTKKIKESGGLWLTDQRLIFASVSSHKSTLQSLTIPLPSILSTKFEQPFIGSNYLAIEIKPSLDGGLTHGTKVEIRLKDQALFSFASTLEKSRERAIYMKRQSSVDEEGLPSYQSPRDEAGPSSFQSPLNGPVPSDAPPSYDA